MPPDPPPSSFPEPPDPLALLDQAVGDLIALALPTPPGIVAVAGTGPLPGGGGAFLPPIAGGQLPGFLEDAWDWTSDNLLDPAGDFLSGILAEIGRIVSGAVTTVLSWILKWVYRLTRGMLLQYAPATHHFWFPSVFDEDTQSPYVYLRRVFHLVGEATLGIVDDAADWLQDRVWDAVGWVWNKVGPWFEYAIERVWDAAGWVWNQVSAGLQWVVDRVWDAAGWVWNQVSAGLQWVVDRVWDAAGWVWNQIGPWFQWLVDRVWDAAGWVWNQIGPWFQWTVDQVSGGFGAVTDALQDGLQWAWDNVISKIPEGIVAGAAEIGKLIREAFEWLVNTILVPVGEYGKTLLGIIPKMWRGEYTSMEEIWDDLNFTGTPALLILGVIAMFLILPAFSIALSTVMAESLEPMRQNLAKRIGTRTVFEGTGRELLQRGEWGEDVYLDHLRRQGFSEDSARDIMILAEKIPGPTDLVRMGVREVFTPEIAERFGQFEDFPPAFGEWMAKQGFTDFWAKAFWGAHWDLPSVTQGFQMRHRDVIGDEDLQLLLRALDVMPFWRDKLTDIAFRVISRVDVRRMYAEGVFERDQVKRVYLDLGYKPEDAEALTEFVVRRYPRKGTDEPSDLRSLTISSVKQAYARRLITGDDALERLMELDYSADDAALVISIWEFDWTQDPSLRSDVDPKGLARSTIEKAYERRLIDLNAGVLELGELGYTPEDARLLLQLVDLRLDEQLADLEIDGLVSDYQDGIISDGQLAAALADLNIPQGRIDFLLQREILQRQAKRRRLTLSQMKKALAADLMGEGEYRARLAAVGYNARDVDILVTLNVEAV